MSQFGLAPFDLRCPEIADRETRTILVREGGTVPPGEYCLLEYYCQDPQCDCRRVLLQIRERSRPDAVLASISFGWESPAYYARRMHSPELAEEMSGASLDPTLPQSEFAVALFEMICEMSLRDGDYIRRLMRHYTTFRRHGGRDSQTPNASLTAAIEWLQSEITRFGKEHLDEELTGFALELLKRIPRDSEVNLTRGARALWAAAVVHVIARNNFLFDSSQPVHLTFDTICDFFAVKKASVGEKATRIEKALHLKPHAEEGITRPDFFEKFSMVRLSNGIVISRQQAKARGLL